MIEQFIQQLPRAELVIGYGSGLFKQSGYGDSKPMIDLIIGVEDSFLWHQENLRLNQNHYSGPSYFLGANYINRLNNWIFPMHFSPFVKFQDREIKYGVVEMKTMIRDLETWRWLSFAGRLHKPVQFIQDTQDSRFHQAYEQNLQSAISVCLLLSQKTKRSLGSLLYDIIGLSYVGDIRFTLGSENAKKIQNILEGNYQQIAELFIPYIDKMPFIEYDHKSGYLTVTYSPESILSLCEQIPYHLATQVTGTGKDQSMTFQMMDKEAIRELLQFSIQRKNMFSSKRMLLYTGLSISPALQIKYALSKWSKK